MDGAMIPYTTERRPDTGVDNVTLGFWLFIASEVMLFGALFSSYALLRVSATDWPAGSSVLEVKSGIAYTLILLLTTWLFVRYAHRSPQFRLISASVFAALFLVAKGDDYWDLWSRGLVPAASTFWAMYYTLTGLHAVHVLGGILANLWVLSGLRSVSEAMTAGRLRVLLGYWVFLDLVWLAIFAGLYL
jgi:cytochrome c oxidase subunit 3